MRFVKRFNCHSIIVLFTSAQRRASISKNKPFLIHLRQTQGKTEVPLPSRRIKSAMQADNYLQRKWILNKNEFPTKRAKQSNQRRKRPKTDVDPRASHPPPMSTTASVKRIHYRSPTPAPASAILSFVNRILNGRQREEIGSPYQSNARSKST